MEATRAQAGGGYISLGRLTPAELVGCVAGVGLALALLLPWFGTSENPNSMLAGASGGDSVTGWEVFDLLKWALVAAGAAPFILAWIVARSHKLSWKPGEVTMVVGTTAFVLSSATESSWAAPENAAGESIEISFQIGYFAGLVAALPRRQRLPAPGALHPGPQAPGRDLISCP